MPRPQKSVRNTVVTRSLVGLAFGLVLVLWTQNLECTLSLGRIPSPSIVYYKLPKAQYFHLQTTASFPWVRRKSSDTFLYGRTLQRLRVETD